MANVLAPPNGAQESLLTPGTQQQIEVIHSLLDGNGHGR